MKVLILSCNTGEGHNSAGKAVKEYIESQGDLAEFRDMMMLGGKRTSKVVGGAYVNVVKYCPLMFALLYRLGRMISSSKRKSPVYFACSLLGKRLKKYLEENEFDVIVTPHLYPAETLTWMKRKGILIQKTVAIATDYTSIPFWEETECDYYIIPHEDLTDEFAGRGIPREKLLPWGIPVRKSFEKNRNRQEAREVCGLSQEHLIYLVMGGSMGFGKIQIFVRELARRLKDNEEIVVICGNNQKLEQVLRKELEENKKVHILGFTDQVAEYMAACDVIFTKPGGLSSTEAAISHIPIVHTNPIPGCEDCNLEFFQSRGMSIGRKSFFGQLRAGQKILSREKLRRKMILAQEQYSKPEAAQRIYCHLKRLSGEQQGGTI